METQPARTLAEIALSYRYAQAHGWVVQAVTGWLSAYYMEDPRFRVSRSYDELETGIHVWLCEVEGPASIKRLLRRLQADLPGFEVRERAGCPGEVVRHLIDLPDFTPA
jgi:hypothetical protein